MVLDIRGSFYWAGLTLIPTWISNPIDYSWFPRGPYCREKYLFWNMGVLVWYMKMANYVYFWQIVTVICVCCGSTPPGALWWGAFQWGSHGGEMIHHRGVSSGWSNIWHSYKLISDFNPLGPLVLLHVQLFWDRGQRWLWRQVTFGQDIDSLFMGDRAHSKSAHWAKCWFQPARFFSAFTHANLLILLSAFKGQDLNLASSWVMYCIKWLILMS